MKGRAKTIYQSYGENEVHFIQLKLKADVQYLCLCLKTCYVTAPTQREHLDQSGELRVYKEGGKTPQLLS